jgi:diaminopimelate decarboxylase
MLTENNRLREAFKLAQIHSLIREEDTAVVFHDLDLLRERVLRLGSAFPENTLHCIAIKTNPLLKILEFLRDLGTGAEAATIGEVMLALKAGFPPGKIVYDSPVKTVRELEYALQQGIHINIDNFSELKRVKNILRIQPSESTFGLRINPQVGYGTIAETSVAGEYSKFGIPITTRRADILRAFLEQPWLTGLHLHIGSQGYSPDLLVKGAGVMYDLMLEIDEARKSHNLDPLRIVDIGGGFPVSYSSEKEAPSMEEYAREVTAPWLSRRVREGGMGMGNRLITEFGRWVHVNTGFTVSRVEYVKREPGINTAMIHLGADMFVRECLSPSGWDHEYSVLDRYDNLKTGVDPVPYNLAGPLCFAGDIVAKNVRLPVVKAGDYIVIHDTGGYTFCMWSRYNSRFAPRVIGIRNGKPEILKEREGFYNILDFWR